MPEQRQDLPHENTQAIPGNLWRRVNCANQLTIDPKVPGGRRPRSDLFEDGRNEFGETDPISAFDSTQCQHPQVALNGHQGFGLIMVREEVIAECGLTIRSDPRPGPPGHVLLIGNKTKRVRKRLALSAEWVVRCP